MLLRYLKKVKLNAAEFRVKRKMSIFVSSESTTLPVGTAYQGGTFLFIATMKYNKQPLDIPTQIAMLKGRGLNIADEQAAEKTLSRISYFRLAAYLRPMEADKNTHQYKPMPRLKMP